MSKEQVAVIAVPDMHKVDHRYLTSVTIMRLRDKAAVAIAEYNAAIEACPHPENERRISYCNTMHHEYCGICGLFLK